MMTLSTEAQKHFLKIIKPGQKVILGTKRSGCSGLRYQLEIVDDCDIQAYQKLDTELNLPFFVETKSLPYLKGMVIDLVQEGLQSRIIYKNPNETGQCGCGESFSVS